MVRCDKMCQGVIRGDKKLGDWDLILKLPNENSFASKLGDKV